MKPVVGSVVILNMGARKYPALVLCVVEDGTNQEHPMLNLAHSKIDAAGNPTEINQNEVDLALSTSHEDDNLADLMDRSWSFAFEPEDVELVLGITPAKEL